MFLLWLFSLLIFYTKIIDGQIAMSCNDGWELFQCKCYRISSDVLSWLEAEEECQKEGAHLVIIESLQEQEYISEKNVLPLWLGLSDRIAEGQWRWTDDSVLNFSSWLPNQPNNGLQEDCVELASSPLFSLVKGWNDAGCELRKSYMCEGSPDIVGLGRPLVRQLDTDVQLEWIEGMECISHMEVWELSQNGASRTRQWIFNNYDTPQPGYAISFEIEPLQVHRIHMRAVVDEVSSPELVINVTRLPHGEESTACPVECECEEGWVKMHCSCYQMGQTIATWEEAEEECARIESHLVSVHSKLEQKFIFEMSNVLWIGLRSDYGMWSDGSIFDYHGWLDDEEVLEEGSGFSGDGMIEDGSGFSGEGMIEDGSGFDGESPHGYMYDTYYDEEDFYIEVNQEQPSHGDDITDRSDMNCVKLVGRHETNGWDIAYCDEELPFMCKKPANIVSCRTPQTYVEEGENNSTNIQLHWRTENTCNVLFNVTHHNNGITLHSVNENGGIVLHYRMHQSDTGILHRLHLNAMLGYHPEQSHSISLLVKPNHYKSDTLI